MMPEFPMPVLASLSAAMPGPAWSLYGEGHVLAATIVRDDSNVEAHVLLDGRLLYRSRHTTWASAAEEIVALRGHWAREGWIEAS